MPLRFVNDSNMLADAALRQHRGTHDVIGTGPCARLADIIPHDIHSSGGQPAAVRLSWGLVEFLALPLLMAGDDMGTTLPTSSTACRWRGSSATTWGRCASTRAT